MRAASTLTALGVALATAAAPAAGVGFGRSSNATVLGQPLNFTASLRLDPEETLSRECVLADVQSGDNPLAPAQVRVALESPTESNERRVRVTTRTPIDEPIVTVTLTIGCTAPVTRRFVAFVDPPALNLAQSAPVEAPPPAQPPVAAPAAAPPAAAIAVDRGAPKEVSAPRALRERRPRPPDPEAATAPPAVRSTPARGVAEPASAAASEPSRRSSPRLAASVPKRAPGPRLQLESGAVAAAPAAAASPVPPAATSASPARTAIVASPEVAPSAAPRATAMAVAPPAASTTVAGVSSTASAGGAPAPATPVASSSPAGARPGATQQAAGSATETTEPAATGVDSLATERARLRLLEEGFAKLRDESRANDIALATLQLRLQQAESERYGNPLVYALALLSAVLALALVFLGRRNRRPGGGWWVGREAGPAPSMYDERAEASAAPTAPVMTGPAGAAASPEPPKLPQAPLERVATGASVAAPSVAAARGTREDPELEATRPAPFVASRAAPLASPPMPASPPAIPPVVPPARELSVEELIDLEQQVDFFAVLGQDEAAIELLMSHLRSDGGMSPLPFLKLLEIYRRRGDAEAYARVRGQFNRRFNAYAPGPEDDLAQGRALADYPATMRRLQQLWPFPRRAMEAVDASLFRRYETEETFDLPAYRELLFLYGVARDLAEHAEGAASARSDVDFALPFDDEPHDPPIGRLSASSAQPADFQASELTTLPLDLDVTLGPATPATPPNPLDAETVPSALRRTDNRMFSTESNFLSFDNSIEAARSKDSR